MKNFPYLLVLLISIFFESSQGQCSGGIWPIQNAGVGSFTVFWRYNIASNTVQFIIEGQAAESINLRSTYIALGWSDSTPTMINMDVAMFFPGTQIVQDRYSRERSVPSVDSQQDFCVIRTNITDRNVYVAFERFVGTGDSNDISFIPNLYLMFSIGSYTSSDGSTFNPQYHSFRIAQQTTVNLVNCTSNACSTTNCPITSCPCLQQAASGAAQCVCFPPSSCISGSTITPRTNASTTTTTTIPSTSTSTTTTTTTTTVSSTSTSTTTTTTTTTTVPSTRTSTVVNVVTTTACQCVNGGICTTNGACLCSNLFAGRFCQLNNPCATYCRNNGVCSVTCTDTSCGSPTCACINGYTGAQCDIMSASIVCQPNPCVNGQCIVTANSTFQCQCINGFFGVRCDMINSCLSNPCNQGTCLVSSNCVGILCGYSCVCPNGTTGTNCQIGANPCLSAPCRNNGTCSVSTNGYSCQCLQPYGGTTCDVITNICTPNPCVNNGICIRDISLFSYRCQCLNGYIGARCEYLSGCISSPCRNNAQCIASTANCSSTTCAVTCLCATGTTGAFCELQDSSCLTSPCLNGGTCAIIPLTNTYVCQCPSNTTGLRCETNQLRCTSTFCSNNGVCYIDASSGNTTLRCICSIGYTGVNCQSMISSLNPCLSNPCGNNGTCSPSSNFSYSCLCPDGLIAQSCAPSSLVTCANSPCHYLSRCQPRNSSDSIGYQCICPDYLVGARCQHPNSCQKQPCFNQGTCVPMGPQNSYMCLCQPGFGQYDCSTNLGLTCTSAVCLNGGTCTVNGSTAQCICPSNFAGARCEWTAICSSTTCLNGGTCRQTAPTIVECLCANGFTGPTCALRDSCVGFPCRNGAGCASLLTNTGTGWSTYRCTCPPGFYGQNCDTSISSCATVLCQSFQICSEQPTGPVCTCPGSKVGTFCQYDNPCASLPSGYCRNGGTCVATNTDPPIPSCLCRTGLTGSQCEVNLSDNPCASNPCQGRGFCALSATNTSYSCICHNNYTGSQCERTNPCLSSPCMNQGVCQGAWNATNTWFTCLCVGTFTGTRCETSTVNVCGGLCMNGSPCVNGACVCPPQFIGRFCGLNNPCFNNICYNGGSCLADYNSSTASFTCICSSFYSGRLCENLANTQAQFASGCSSGCLNGGTCMNNMCMCTVQFFGPICQYRNPCLNENPCMNSGTCFGQYSINGSVNTVCFCSQGYTGTFCEATLCSTTVCNGGVCTAAQNSFVCSCPTGRSGDRCQFADLCLSNPCSPTEQCQQTQDRIRCVSCFDRSTFCSTYQTMSEFCHSRYALLVNNTYVPVPDACQLSCNRCAISNRSNEMLPAFAMRDDSVVTMIAEEFTTDSTTTTSSSTTTPPPFRPNIIFSRIEKCFDKRDDCSLQKEYGFCTIFNEKYPDDCTQTCHPDCASDL